jgi:hypothetical protein
MQTITFTYTKDESKVSDRVLLVLEKPSQMFKGIDITELFDKDPNLAAKFVEKVEEAHALFLKEIKALQKEYDLTHNFRQFLQEKMTEVVII